MRMTWMTQMRKTKMRTAMRVKKEKCPKSQNQLEAKLKEVVQDLNQVQFQVSLLVPEDVVEEAWPFLQGEVAKECLLAVVCLLVKEVADEVWLHLAEVCHLVKEEVAVVWLHQAVVCPLVNEEVAEVWLHLAEVCHLAKEEVAVVWLHLAEVCLLEKEVAVVWLQVAAVWLHLVVVCLQVKEAAAVVWL